MSVFKERRAKWAEALRSGDYEQIKGRLRDGNGYCCLGVACDVFRSETGEGEWGVRAHPPAGFGAAFQNFHIEDAALTVFLPRVVAQWFGIQRTGLDSHLMRMNDRGELFPAIADVLEAHE